MSFRKSATQILDIGSFLDSFPLNQTDHVAKQPNQKSSFWQSHYAVKLCWGLFNHWGLPKASSAFHACRARGVLQRPIDATTCLPPFPWGGHKPKQFRQIETLKYHTVSCFSITPEGTTGILANDREHPGGFRRIKWVQAEVNFCLWLSSSTSPDLLPPFLTLTTIPSNYNRVAISSNYSVLLNRRG
jgi:hypothetical protein